MKPKVSGKTSYENKDKEMTATRFFIYFFIIFNKMNIIKNKKF